MSWRRNKGEARIHKKVGYVNYEIHSSVFILKEETS